MILRSADIADDKRQELLRLFPEVATEGGKLDLERLRLALGEAIDVGKERYGLLYSVWMSVRSLKEIPGIEFVVDARGRPKSVVIDLGLASIGA